MDADFARAGYKNVYNREISAYIIDRLAGFDLVPETVEFNGSRGVGSLQRFVENAKLPYESPVKLQYDDRFFAFDILIANVDRHNGNAMIKVENGVGKWVAIDNGFSLLDNEKLSRSFSGFRQPGPDYVRGFSEETITMIELFMDKESEVRAALSGRLTDKEIDSIFDRARFILAQDAGATITEISDNFKNWIRGRSDERGVPLGINDPRRQKPGR